MLKWLVEVGGEVKRGEPLVEIETDKANMTYEADTDGVLLEVVAAEGDTLAVGEVIARIGAEGEKPARPGGRQPAAQRARGPAPEPEHRSGAPARPPGGQRRRADQGLAGRAADGRRAGRRAGRLEGSGPGGRIVKADVEAAAGNGAPAQARRKPARPPAAEPPAPGARARRPQSVRKGEPEVRRAHPASAHGLAPDGRVQGHRARLRARGRGGHDAVHRAARAAEGAAVRRRRCRPTTT